MKRPLLMLGGVAVLAAAIVAGLSPASGADHGDAPLTKANAQLDINDVYIFSGDRADRVVLALTVNPLSMPGAAPTFATDGVYELKVDQDGDAVADLSYRATFGAANASGVQSVTVRRENGAAADDLGSGGSTIIEGSSTAATASAANVIEEDDYRLFAGLRDDPFFFDLNAFRNSLMFRDPGVDFFAGTNVSIIVLEVPESEIVGDDGTFGVWGVTHRNGSVVDRMGRPAINTVFVPTDAQKDAFNQTAPVDDVAEWKDTFVATLNSLGADPGLADVLLPDIFAVDTAMPLGFLNGRAPADDVIDAELQLITGNSAATDNVDANDRTFPQTFPFFASPNTAPLPATPAAPAPTAAAPARTPTSTTGVTAPDTGTGDGMGGDSDATMWVIIGVAALAATMVGGGFALRGRGRN